MGGSEAEVGQVPDDFVPRLRQCLGGGAARMGSLSCFPRVWPMRGSLPGTSPASEDRRAV